MIHTTLVEQDEARSAHPRSFDLPSRIQTVFAHPTPVPGTDNRVNELRVLANRRYDQEGDQGEDNAS